MLSDHSMYSVVEADLVKMIELQEGRQAILEFSSEVSSSHLPFLKIISIACSLTLDCCVE